MLTLPGCGGVKIASKGAKLASKGVKAIKGAKAAKTGAVATKGALADDVLRQSGKLTDDALRQSGKLADNALLTADDAARGGSKSAKQSDEIKSAIYDVGDKALQYALENNQQTLTVKQQRQLVLQRQMRLTHQRGWENVWHRIGEPVDPLFDAWQAIQPMDPNNPEKRELFLDWDWIRVKINKQDPQLVSDKKSRRLARDLRDIASEARRRR
jgi:hypothetical protein